MDPAELLYSKTHEWVAVNDEDGAQVATVGISAFAVEALTDLVYIELPTVGKQVQRAASFCEVESVKAVSDIYAPVDGEVIAVNDALADALETLSRDPYGEGWIARIKVADAAGLQDLMSYDDYQKKCAEEEH